MSCCEPEDDQNVTGLAFVGSHGLPQSVWKSDWLKCRIIGQTKPPAGSAAPLIRATAVAPAMSVDCPLAVPNRPRYVRFACTRTKTVAGATVLPPVTRLPGAGHPPAGCGKFVHVALSTDPQTAIVSGWLIGRKERFASAT